MKRMLPTLLKLLLLLATVSHGTATSCDITEGETVDCYGTLGQSVYINLKTVTSHQCSGQALEIKFNGHEIFRCKKKDLEPVLSEACENHCRLDKGAFILYNLSGSHSGEYSIEEFDSNGTSVQRGKITLTIQADPKSFVIPVVLGTCFLLLALLLATWYLYKKKQKQPETSQRSAGDRREDPQELVYCEVQVMKKTEQPKSHEQEPQVVYGEVKVSDSSKAARHAPGGQTDTVYSGIRT